MLLFISDPLGEDVGSGKGERAPGPAMLGREEAGREEAGWAGAVAGMGAGVVSDASGDAWMAVPPVPAPGAEAGVAAALSVLGALEGAAGGVFRPNSMNVDPQSGSAGGLDKATPRHDTAFRRIVR
ncbi:hypothetical protein ACIU1J_11405 [Azospirillum doebereinerae]|uniref:hypothetical protein n=1 Tax=Azospirillum doebereinerae TaxID=92933 RepID=UPI00384F5119